MKLLLPCVMIFITAVSVSQTTSTGPITTPGPCSSVSINSTSPVTINCKLKGISKEEGRRIANEYAQILNQIRSSNLSFKEVMDKLNAISADVTDIKKATASRHLSKSQVEVLVNRLRPYANSQIGVISTLNDGESEDYAVEFLLAFEEAGVAPPRNKDAQPRDTMMKLMPSTVMHGIFLNVHPEDRADHTVPPQCQILAQTIVQMKIPFHITIDASMNSRHECMLYVGQK